MRTGIGFPSYAGETVFASASGASFNSLYPVTNLSDLVEPRLVALTGTGTSVGITGVLPATRDLGFVALVHPSFTVDATMRVRLFSGTGADPVANAGTMVYDSGERAVWPLLESRPMALFRGCRPLVLPGIIRARSAHILLASPTSQAWELGAIELAGWYPLTDVGLDRANGLDSQSQLATLSGGVDHVTEQWSPRVWTGNRQTIDEAEAATTLMDFRVLHGIQKPFVFVDDPDDAASWPRRCFLARNMDPPTDTGAMGLWAATDLSFVEHL